MNLLLLEHIPGLVWKMLSVIGFAGATLLLYEIQRTEPALSPIQISFFQSSLPLVVMLLVNRKFWGKGFVSLGLTGNPKNALLRATCGVFGFLSWTWSLKLLPLGVAASFRLLGPVVTFLAAVLFLKEKPSWGVSVALVLSLMGSGFLAHREIEALHLWAPGSWANFLALGIPLCTLVAFAGANLFGKRLLTGERAVSPVEATLSLLLLSSLGLGILVMPLWVWPSPRQWLVLSLVGGLDAFAQWALSQALHLSPLSLISPLSVWRFALLALGSVFIFHEPPRPELWLGILVMLGMTALLMRGRG